MVGTESKMGDCRDWREAEYKAAMVAERDARARTVFSARFTPSECNAPDKVATATSNGRVAVYSIVPPVSSQLVKVDESELQCPVMAEPLVNLGKHEGPAYDLIFYGQGENMLILSCGDDGRIQGWRWDDVFNSAEFSGEPILDLKNPQQKVSEMSITFDKCNEVVVRIIWKGPRSALSPIPETNAITADVQANRVFAAAGDGCAYSWDMETLQPVMVFDGHSDYLHCIASRSSQKQVITGSEDGTTVIWDCRSGDRVAALDSWKASKAPRRAKEKSPWVSCMSLDTSENWLVCGNGGCSVTLWSLPGLDAVTRIATFAPPQAVTIADDQIVTVGAQPHLSRWSFGGTILSQVKCAPPSAFSVSVHQSGTTVVAGYGGLVDIITEFGSHLCTFRCK